MKTKWFLIIIMSTFLFFSCGKKEKNAHKTDDVSKTAEAIDENAALKSRVNAYFGVFSNAIKRGTIDFRSFEPFLEPALREDNEMRKSLSRMSQTVPKNVPSNLTIEPQITNITRITDGTEAIVKTKMNWKTEDGKVLTSYDMVTSWKFLDGEWYYTGSKY